MHPLSVFVWSFFIADGFVCVFVSIVLRYKNSIKPRVFSKEYIFHLPFNDCLHSVAMDTSGRLEVVVVKNVYCLFSFDSRRCFVYGVIRLTGRPSAESRLVAAVSSLPLSQLSCSCSWNGLVGLVVKVSASRVEDPGFESHLRQDPGIESCLHQDFSRVESYQWLKNWHSSGYPARRLAL